MKILNTIKVPTGQILIVEGNKGKLEMLSLGDYTSPEPYQELDHRFKKSGFETLVFIASEDEDLSRITCGNAILSEIGVI